MADHQSPVEEVADKSAQVAIAGVSEAWPYRKVLLAVLPPTVALLIAVIGVWDNGNRDRAAQAEAEKDRVAAAQEAEIARAAEVEKDQKAAEKESRLREAELVLPRYTDLVADTQTFRTAAGRCLRVLQPYLADENPAFDLSEDGQLELVAFEADLDPREDGIPESELIRWPVPSRIFDECEGIAPALEPLETSLAKALLVSNPSLETQSENLVTEFRGVVRSSERLLNRLEEDPCDPTCAALTIEPFISSTNRPGDYFVNVSGLSVDPLGCCFWFEDGTPTAAEFLELDQALRDVEVFTKCLVKAVQGVVLEVVVEVGAEDTNSVRAEEGC